MYFGTKSYLKSTRNHTAKHALPNYVHGQSPLFFTLGNWPFQKLI